MSDARARRHLQQRLEFLGIVAHEHGHDVDLRAAMRRGLPQRVDGPPRAIEGARQLPPAIVTIARRVIDRHADLREAGVPQRARLLAVHVPAVGVEERNVALREDRHDVHEIGPDQGLPSLDRDEKRAEAAQLFLDAREIRDGQFVGGRHAVRPEVAEGTLHVAAVRHSRTWNGFRRSTPAANRMSRRCSRHVIGSAPATASARRDAASIARSAEQSTRGDRTPRRSRRRRPPPVPDRS